MTESLPCPACRADIAIGAGTPPATCPQCHKSLVVCGHYRIQRLLGRGGMGAVYAASDERSGEQVAAKVLWLGEGADWKSYELFGRGSRALQSLQHRSLPRVHAFEESAEHPLCLVRETFDGGTLEQRVRSGQRVDARTLRLLLRRLLELLDFLHGQSPPILHRDIKPSNIMFRTAGDWDPVLVDFDSIAEAGDQTTRMTIVCSPGYTAPEQLAGQVSPASDLYSLGATMLFVATGTEPDQLPRKEGKVVVGKALDHLDKRLRQAVVKLVEPTPDRRYESARLALADLGEAVASAAAGPAGVAAAPASNLEALAAKARNEQALQQQREAERLRQVTAAHVYSSPYRVAVATTAWHLWASWVFQALLLTTGATVLPIAVLVVVEFVKPPISSGALMQLIIGALVSIQLVFGGVALLRGRWTRRQTQAWLDALPFEVRGYLQMLGRPRFLLARIWLRIEFVSGCKDLPTVVDALGALERGFKVETARGDPAGFVLEVTTCSDLSRMFTNRVIHRWFKAAIDQVLLDVHRTRGAIRYVDVASEEEELKLLRGE